jgi:hypothetical protein
VEQRRRVERLDICLLLAHVSVTLDAPLQSLRSLLSFVNADMSGLSCKLLPFFPLNPHLPAPPPAASSSASAAPATAAAAAATAAVATVGLRRCCSPPPEPEPDEPSAGAAAAHLDPPPRMAATLECAQRACLRIADVTVMHSVATRPTASTAMVTGACAVSGSAAAGAGAGAAGGACMWAAGAGLRVRSARAAPSGDRASGMLRFAGM